MDNPKNTKTKVIEVRVTEELDREFKAVVRAQGLTESQVIRGLVEEYIRDWEKTKNKESL